MCCGAPRFLQAERTGTEEFRTIWIHTHGVTLQIQVRGGRTGASFRVMDALDGAREEEFYVYKVNCTKFKVLINILCPICIDFFCVFLDESVFFFLFVFIRLLIHRNAFSYIYLYKFNIYKLSAPFSMMQPTSCYSHIINRIRNTFFFPKETREKPILPRVYLKKLSQWLLRDDI